MHVHIDTVRIRMRAVTTEEGTARLSLVGRGIEDYVRALKLMKGGGELPKSITEKEAGLMLKKVCDQPSH